MCTMQDTTTPTSTRHATAAPAPLGVDPTAPDEALLAAVLGHWHDCLMGSPDRETILATAGVSLALAEQLGLGFSDRSLGLRVPHRRTKAGLALRSRLDALGILRGSGHEAFRGCLTVPVTDAAGSVVGIFGARTDRHFSGVRGMVWAAGLPGAVFGSPADDGPTLVVATIADALAVIGAGQAAVAPGRERGFSAAELTALAGRGREFVALGRGSGPVAEALGSRGATVSVAAPDVAVARTLASAPDPAVALVALLSDCRSVGPEDDGPRPGVLLDPGGPGTPEVPEARPAAIAGPVPAAGTTGARPPATVAPGADEVFVHSGTRSWRVRGAGARANAEGDLLRVALMVTEGTSGRFHLDTVDLYSARARSAFLAAATTELRAERDTLALELAEVLATAERARDDAVSSHQPVPEMTPAEREEAMAWLSVPGLLDRLGDDLAALGVVGERTNLLVAYLAVTSRLCERPFGVLVQSSSAAGKSTLTDAVCGLVPTEQLVSLSAITAQALYYCSGGDLAHKVLSVAEDHGASRAAYALKLLVSEGRLAIAAAGKDRHSGRLETSSYQTAGPVALLMTTTAADLDPELENRLVVLGVDEDPAQTAAILAAQRRAASLEGLCDRARRDAVRRRHRNLQRLLVPYPVVIPDCDVGFPASATRHRRDHQKLLSIVAALTVLHQHQREHKTAEVEGSVCTYLEATEEDVALGLALARVVLVRDPEHLAPHTARLLDAIREHTAAQASERRCAPEEVAVTRRELRAMLGWSEVQVRRATDRLVALEYLAASGGGRGRCRTYTYVTAFEKAGQGSSAVGHPGRRTDDGPSPGGPGGFVGFVGFVGTEEAQAAETPVGGGVPGGPAETQRRDRGNGAARVRTGEQR